MNRNFFSAIILSFFGLSFLGSPSFAQDAVGSSNLEIDLEGTFYEALQVGNVTQAEEILSKVTQSASDTNQAITASQLIFSLASHYFDSGNKEAALK